jgi:hypothetical protein
MKHKYSLLLALALSLASAARAETMIIAAAADLKFAKSFTVRQANSTLKFNKVHRTISIFLPTSLFRANWSKPD